MLPTPKKFKIVAASAEGDYPLSAFDHALLKAGIGNVNLLRISSILPPGAVQDQDMLIPPGSLVPTAYAKIDCEQSGTLISAAVGIGFSKDTFGVIMEYSGKCGREQAEEQVKGMLKEAFANRDLKLQKTLVLGVEHRVQKAGACIAAVILWY
ncbi:MAG: pyruvoyl-dependent arginine decarboxylase [Dethiobacteria bacterium]|jgi:arginine decarboxylase|nr:arginine decarboxylase, pyruvoyl-dependent [Bacillota bacterium]